MQHYTPIHRFFPAELLLAAQDVQVLFLDVDGVLTDGGLYFTEEGEALKRFNTLDGYGLTLLKRVNIEPAIITGRDSPALRARLEALGVQHAHYGVTNKRPVAEEILRALNLTWKNAAAMGDDWPDLNILQHCALSCAPANAHAEVRSIARFVTQARGGDGAVRELCDLLLSAHGEYAKLFIQV